ncbi:MAG: hypothetical protein F6K41_08675 [Symploca sp. SIO3E6]|nr:hypothetical protein [Caldora sp. SIO3E6]
MVRRLIVGGSLFWEVGKLVFSIKILRELQEINYPIFGLHRTTQAFLPPASCLGASCLQNTSNLVYSVTCKLDTYQLMIN